MNNNHQAAINEAIFKLIVIGDSGAGKSSLLNRYIKDQFKPNHQTTVGIQFTFKTIMIDQNHRVKLRICDTAGQEAFQSIVKTFYKNSSAVVLVYNLANKRSFQSLEFWVNQARQNSPQDAILVLMATHLDQQNNRQVTKENATAFMNKHNIAIFFQTSSKTAENVNKAFDQVGKQLFINYLTRKRVPDNKSQSTKIQLQSNSGQKKICC